MSNKQINGNFVIVASCARKRPTFDVVFAKFPWIGKKSRKNEKKKENNTTTLLVICFHNVGGFSKNHVNAVDCF